MSLLLPDGSTYVAPAQGSDRIVLTDIHGRLSTFQRAVETYPDRTFVILGDVIDRGPDSPGCMALVRQLVNEGRAVLMMGNHEKMMLDAFFHPNPDHREMVMDVWGSNGGDATLTQYHALDQTGALLVSDMEFIAQHAHDWFVEGEFLYAHAGRPRMLPDGTLPDMPLCETHLWGRPADGILARPAGVKWTIHGHTPLPHPYIDEEEGVAYIDLGPSQLAALDTRTMNVFQFRNLEQSRLITV